MIGALALVLLGACLAQGRTPYYLSYHAPTVKAKKGVVLVIHGGGWAGGFGANADAIMTTFLEDFQNWGYRTYNLAYREGRALKDTYAAVERLTKRHKKRPLCVFGGSSGGHLALMAAVGRPELVDCVIDVGGPIDFIRPEPGRPYWHDIRDRAATIFGERRLRKVSPIYQTKKIEAAVLVISAECDIYTSTARQRQLAKRVDKSRMLSLAHDPSGYDLGGHCPVGFADIERMRVAEHKWLDRFADRTARRAR